MPTMSQRKVNRSSKKIVDSEDESDSSDAAVVQCVRYLLSREGSKIPIKRSDVEKHCQTPGSGINAVITEANNILKRVYGYKLIQVQGKGGVQYIIVSVEENGPTLPSPLNSNHRVLLMATLTHIFMSGGSVKEAEMYQFLNDAGLLEENDNASRKLLTKTFTRQMYLNYVKEDSGVEIARFVFTWGQRAIEEVPKMWLLNEMAQAFEKSPDYWGIQHREATEAS